MKQLFKFLFFYNMNLMALGKLFKSTKNISTTNFDSLTTKSLEKLGIKIKKKIFFILYTICDLDNLECANYCLYLNESNCNSYHYDSDTQMCSVALLKYLEDPLPGQISHVNI